VEEDNDDCYTRPGQLTIITMHKAKGLDWDYVFIPFLHEDIIPGKPWVPNGAKFLGDFTLAEVARAQIRAAVHQRYLNPDSIPIIPPPLSAWLREQKDFYGCRVKKKLLSVGTLFAGMKVVNYRIKIPVLSFLF
jgi:superfamily I DNA/RNA helicase